MTTPSKRPPNYLPLTPTRFLERTAKLYPGREAVVCGGERFTYRQFQERVNRLSNLLLGLGVSRGDVVAYLELNCHRLLEAYYAIPQIGATLLPLNIRLSPAEIAWIIKDSGAEVVLMDRELAPLLDPVKEELKGRRIVLMGGGEGYKGIGGESFEELWNQTPSGKPKPLPEIDELEAAELFYTSGTTGNPKGAMISHRSLYLHALYLIPSWDIKLTDRILYTVPLFHINGWGIPQFLTAMGGTHVMLRRFEATVVLELVEREKVAKMFMVPTMALMLLNHPELKRYDLSSLIYIVLGGAPSSKELVRDVEQRLGCRCFGAYGMTENDGPMTTTHPNLSTPFLEGLTPEERWGKHCEAGLPILGADVRVVDADRREVKPNSREVGEITLRSDIVMQGYWKRPEETGKVIDEDGYLHTGDMAVMGEDGIVSIVDRQKDLIISGGENIASIEVEKVLLSHPAIQEAAVVGVPDPKWGETPKGVVVLRNGAKVTEGELIEHCRGGLAHFKCPRSIDFVDALPRTSVGKIAKRVLRERYWGGFERRVH